MRTNRTGIALVALQSHRAHWTDLATLSGDSLQALWTHFALGPLGPLCTNLATLTGNSLQALRPDIALNALDTLRTHRTGFAL
ncbi:MAG: hypothetical protein AAB214_08580 [Fibrobacterota bacterium]